MCAVEELRHTITPTLRITDPEQKRAGARGAGGERPQGLGQPCRAPARRGPFVGGATLQVADLKLYMVVRWLTTGTWITCPPPCSIIARNCCAFTGPSANIRV